MKALTKASSRNKGTPIAVQRSELRPRPNSDHRDSTPASGMWVEIVFGIIFYKLFRRFFDDGSDASLADLESSHCNLCFAAASRLERLYGGRCFVGLRIPDPDSATRQHLDIVLVTKREVMVVAIKNFAGFVEDDKVGNWVCTNNEKTKTDKFPDPVLELSKQIANLQFYLQQRGAIMSDGHIVGRVLLANPNCRTSYEISLQQEVISFEKWRDLKPEGKSGLSNWIKDTFHGSKNEMQDALHQNISYILSTSPMWDRLELKGDKNVLGEFIEFKGKHDDMRQLKVLQRAKVGRFIIQQSILFGRFGRSKLQLLYSTRDYRAEGMSSEWKEMTVKSDTLIVFQPLFSTKARKFKLSNVVSVSLSA